MPKRQRRILVQMESKDSQGVMGFEAVRSRLRGSVAATPAIPSI